ncbi:MAG: capsular polysaccharide synthesis protein [Paludibacter sp.]|nr:capsular polysaccharide synthesis protein [Paludibacter sp.]
MLVKNRISSTIRHILKSIRAVSNIPKQLKEAEKFDGYIADFLNGKIDKFTAIPMKPQLVGQKIFWQFWHQGIDENTSKIVVECLNSVKKNSNGYQVILLTNETVWDYVSLPNFVFEKFSKNRFNYANLSDIVRLYLLSAYGGVWLDATIYLTNTIKEKMLNEDFFAFQRSEIPLSDAKIFRKFDPLYFSWNENFQIKMLNSFIIAKPNNKIIADLLSILLQYWKNEKKAGHYFFFQILFNRMILNDEWKNLNCKIVGDTDCHKLQIVALDKFDHKIFDEIKSKSNIHKLTYRFDRFNQIPVGSFFDFIANGKLKQEEKTNVK